MSNNDFLVLKNITKSFGKSTVIDNLDLTIKRGTMVTLLGHLVAVKPPCYV